MEKAETVKKNYDSRGVKRGRCEDCDCYEFEWLPSHPLSTCSYCEHTPAKHMNLTAEVQDSPLPSKSNENVKQTTTRSKKPLLSQESPSTSTINENVKQTTGSKKPLLPQKSRQNLPVSIVLIKLFLVVRD